MRANPPIKERDQGPWILALRAMQRSGCEELIGRVIIVISRDSCRSNPSRGPSVFRVSYTCSGDWCVRRKVCVHSPVARTFFCCTVCLRTSAHLHACAHTRMAQVSVKKVFAYVSFLLISPSLVSCLTHLCCSRTVTSRPLPTTTSLMILSTRSCRTYLP